MVGMVGANGAGKSTLINALAGWSRGRPHGARQRAARGRIDGRAAAASPRRARGLVLVPEGKGIFADLTVTENLALVRPPAGHDRPPRLSMDEIFELFPRLAERRGHGAASSRAASARWWR